MGNQLDLRQHQERHRELHARLDELIADWMTHTGGMPTKATVFDLMTWSAAQCDSPDEDERQEAPDVPTG